MSDTTRKSSSLSFLVTCSASGAETAMLDAMTHSARTPPGVPMPLSISYAESPDAGKSAGLTPHTCAIWVRATGSSILR